MATKKKAKKKAVVKKKTVAKRKSAPKKSAPKGSAPKKSAPKKPAAYPPELARAAALADQTPLGAHVSTAGGVSKAPARALEIGASAIQIFTSSPNQWSTKSIDETEAAAYRAELAKVPVRFVTAHDSYLINLASPDKTLRDRSVLAFTAELSRANTLGLDALVSHPGNFIDDRAAGLQRNADGISAALDAAPGPTRLLMELTAGQGTVLGSTFEELADLLSRIDPAQRKRVGVCLDTCHVFAAGYDLVKDYDGVWKRFDNALGYQQLGCIHLNDSQGGLGSHKDRHALIGDGELGDAVFKRIMTDARLAHVPKVLETPKGDDLVSADRAMLKKLRSFVKH
jgi:deoxyribonuclease-4